MGWPLDIAPPRAEVACVAAEGCSYLRALATIEHIAGFEHAARAYATDAARCREQGCWAASTRAASAPLPAAPTRLPAKSVLPRRATGHGHGQAIPFRRESLIDAVSDAAGNCIERRPLKLETLPRGGDPLGYLHRYWLDLRAAGALHFSSIDTVHLARAGIIGKLHIVDVSSGDPGEFRFELFGYAVPVGHYETPRAHPVKIWSDGLLRDYNTVRLTARPLLQRIRSSLLGVSYHYTRLILPILDEASRVSRLLVAIRQEPGDGVNLDPGQ
jgi:hypothetical protein